MPVILSAIRTAGMHGQHHVFLGVSPMNLQVWEWEGHIHIHCL